MKLHISGQKGVPISQGMIGLFFEDINYAADGGLYAEMIENRSFEFLRAEGTWNDYYTVYDGGYGWSPWPGAGAVSLQPVTGSPHTRENPHYMRMSVYRAGAGLTNKAYEGIYLKKGMEYHVTFWARCVDFTGDFLVGAVKALSDGQSCSVLGRIAAGEGVEETCNFFRKYELTITAGEDVKKGRFVLALDRPGVVELDYVSMFPADAVEGIFRKDLFEKLAELGPGFIRFPGGCIVEGNTLDNRYRYKDSLKENWARKNNWNRWAVHGNGMERGYTGPFSHYNQTLGLGYYEYFLLCERLGAKPLPVLNVGLACQYQSRELVSIDSPQFQEFLQDAVDLIEFANGGEETRWGSVRAKLGHREPFHLTMIGVGNEQWQTGEADFFERYALFEKKIHEYDPTIRLIGSAGPDITSERYTAAWDFYHQHEQERDFVYAVDEHYYVRPDWLYDHTSFYDDYSRGVKVFSGEYAAHPESGRNTLEGALAEAAFLTGVERNADVVVLASYAPLFAREGFAQWSPDMIWFDGERCYGTPSYYVQKLYASNMGDVTIHAGETLREAEKEGIYYSLSLDTETDEIILKAVNRNEAPIELVLELAKDWGRREAYEGWIMSGSDKNAENTIAEPENVCPVRTEGSLSEKLILPGLSFSVLRFKGGERV